MDSNSIARTERNSLSFRQLVHPGCQNTFSATVSIRSSPVIETTLLRGCQAVNRRHSGSAKP
jgi:hypothetical protein